MSFEGTQLGRYQLHQVLGSGGMGEVYLADDSRINRQVAIKVVRSEPALYPDSESSRQAALLFEREMQVISQLDHPHILPLYDYGEAEVSGTTITYMVMPYRPEGSLTSWLHQRKSSAPLSPQDVATLIGQAASALQHTHERRVIHQDVKPSNFLIRIRPEEPEHPDLLLTDFGISRFMAGHSSTSQTIRGTPTYMAPEQWEGRPTYASDQYALAVMTYELLIGHPPFEGRSEPIWFKHLHVTPPAPSSLNTALPSGIDAVLLHALAKKPEERFASVSAFASALQEATTIKQPTIGSTRLLTFASRSGLSLLPNPASQDQPILAQPTHETQGTTEASEPQFSARPESPTAPVSQPQFSPTPGSQIPPPPPPSDKPLKIDVGQFIVQPSVPSATPEANPGRYLALSKLPVIGVISRPPSQWRTPSTTRLLLAALVLILLVISGGLLYTFAIAPNNAPSTRYPATALTQAGNTTMPTSATTSGGAAATQSNTPVPATTQALMGNKQDAQAQVKVDTQATTQVTTQATPDAQATKQALADAQATTQALTDANNQALANANATATAVAVMQLKAPLYRLNNAKTGDHFYTMSASERDTAVAQDGYHYEGIAGYLFSSQVTNTAPLYRLNNAKNGDHFYTMSASERDTAVAQDGYSYEGITGYLFSSQVANTAPLYRLYSATTGDHFYTMSASERNTAVAQDGYHYEFIAGYLYGG